jgi:signal transduction histidine kinase
MARYIAAAVLISVVASAAVLISVRHRAVVRTMQSSARTYSALISPPLAATVEVFRSTGRHILSQRVARYQELNEDVVRLEIVDVEGAVLMVADGNELSTFADVASAPRIDDAVLLEAIRGLEVVSERVADDRGRRVYRVVAPAVEEWGRHTYTLIATFSYRNVNRQLLHALGWLMLHLLVGLILANRVSAMIARTITRNVEQLRAGVSRVQEGNLEERVTIASGDEIQDLAEAFNQMADKLLETIEQLTEANRELESLDQAKSDLVANVSHELKTPLTALRGYLELLSGGELGPLSSEVERAIEVCEKNLRRLSVRIEELVQLAQLERSLVPDLVMDLVPLGQLLHGVVETLLPRLEEKGIVCSLNLATDLCSVRGSPEHLERVFLNILDNATKFTPEGGVIRVSAEPYRHEERIGVVVRVADTGVGIPKDQQLRIFDRFYQVDPSARRRYGGMGLGLALVRSIVEAHRGAVWVESRQSRGSTFFIWLPSQASDSSGHRAVVRRSSSATLQAVRESSGG